MSQDLLVPPPDDVFEALSREATAKGATPADHACEILATRFRVLDGASAAAAPAEATGAASATRLEDFFGFVKGGQRSNADNDAIDADLAREYADPHED